jgi:hypothetical protein
MFELDIFERGITDERRTELIDKIAKKIVDMRMTVPAILFLESVKPLSFIGSQVMVFFQPIFRTFFSLQEYDEIALMLEERGNVERLILAIERIDSER